MRRRCPTSRRNDRFPARFAGDAVDRVLVGESVCLHLLDNDFNGTLAPSAGRRAEKRLAVRTANFRIAAQRTRVVRALLGTWHPGSSPSSAPGPRSCRRRRWRSRSRTASTRSWFTPASTTTPGCRTCRSPTCSCRCPSTTSGSARCPTSAASRSPRNGIARVIESERPDAVLVSGDTNATIAGARAAVAAGVPLLHVEAGLRSYRDDMPEEHNRIETDRLSDLLFAPCEHARDVLLEEGVGGERPRHRRRSRRRAAGDPQPAARDRREGRVRARHRPPQLQHRLSRAPGCGPRLPRGGRVPGDLPVAPADPQEHRDLGPRRARPTSRCATPSPTPRCWPWSADAVAIATDSGGVQREAYLWGVPCITMREETEWIETVSTGWNTLVGVDAEKFRDALAKPRPETRPPIFGDGNAAEPDSRADRRPPRAGRWRGPLPERLRVGVVGCGRMGGFHVRNYAQLECAAAGRGRRPRCRSAPPRASAGCGCSSTPTGAT